MTTKLEKRIEHLENKFDELLDLFTNTLNFKVSDIQGRETGWAWLRAFPSPYHHDFALTRGKENN